MFKLNLFKKEEKVGFMRKKSCNLNRIYLVKCYGESGSNGLIYLPKALILSRDWIGKRVRIRLEEVKKGEVEKERRKPRFFGYYKRGKGYYQ